MSEAENAKSWDLWVDFCAATGRELKWGILIAEELRKRGILPCHFVLDVGCGTGEFTSVFLEFSDRTEGLDVVDIRKNRSFQFNMTDFRDYKGDTPDVLIFKQSFHLMNNPEGIPARFPGSFIIVAQMPRPDWDKRAEWERIPLSAEHNAAGFRRGGRVTEVIRMEQRHSVELPLLAKMFCQGYTSDLRRLTAEERTDIWDGVKDQYNAGGLFLDALDLIISEPLQKW